MSHSVPIPPRFAMGDPSSEELAQMSALAKAIERMVVEGVGDPEDDPELAAALDAWHERANRRFEPVEFRTYYGSMSIEDFVAGALAPVATFVDDLTFEEAQMLLVAVMSATLRVPPTWICRVGIRRRPEHEAARTLFVRLWSYGKQWGTESGTPVL